jgi:hypothetical protein
MSVAVETLKERAPKCVILKESSHSKVVSSTYLHTFDSHLLHVPSLFSPFVERQRICCKSPQSTLAGRSSFGGFANSFARMVWGGWYSIAANVVENTLNTIQTELGLEVTPILPALTPLLECPIDVANWGPVVRPNN